MAITHSIDLDLQIIVNRFYGVITTKMFLEHMANVSASMTHASDLRCIVIFEEDADFSQIVGDALIAIIKKSPLINTPIYTVTVIPNKLIFGLSRLYAAYGTDSNVTKIVSTIEEACDLQNISLQDLDKLKNNDKNIVN
ncbi:MAG: hypothetical protein ACI9CE_000324 [Flavobacterium sp.]|jgi:hypothetical protein